MCTELTILERRRIEARILKPVFEEMTTTLGERRARAILERAIERDAMEQGREYASRGPDAPSLLGFHSILSQWSQDGALEVELLSESETEVAYDVIRCRYAEMYRDLGLAELGSVLSCHRDASFCRGYDPRIELTRTQTIMQGASHCDFRYRWRHGDEPESP